MRIARRRRALLSLAAAAAMAAGTLVGTSPAAADEHDPTDLSTLPIELIPCNLDDLAPVLPPNAFLTLCLEITFGDGQASFGSIDTAIAGPIKIRQVVAIDNTFEIVMVDEHAVPPGDDSGSGGGGGGLDFPPIQVPGGLLGSDLAALDPLLAPVTGVTVTIETLGDLALNDLNTTPLVGALIGGSDPGPFTLAVANLPLRVKVDNLLLGDTCYVGTPNEPIDLNLPLDLSGLKTWEIFDPVTPMVAGYYVWEATATDAQFAIPGADGCGILGLGNSPTSITLFNDLLNQAVGLPAPAGTNLLSFTGHFGITLGGADGITCGFPGICF